MFLNLAKILSRVVIYTALLFIIFVSWSIVYFSEDNKQIPPQVVSYIEESIETLSDDMDIFISYAEVKFIGFEEGFNITLKDGYIQMGKNIITSIPEMSAKIKLTDLIFLNFNLKEVYLQRPQIVITNKEDKKDFDKAITTSFFKIYKNIIYNLFEAINKDSKLIPVEKVVINNVNFSFNQAKEFQSFLLKKVNFQFYTLQDSTYLKTDIETDIEQKNTKLSANARLLENERMILSFKFTQLPYEILSGLLASELVWLNEIKPILDGDGNILMEKEGVASTISLNTGFDFDTKKFKNTDLQFKGQVDFIPKEDERISPLVKAKIILHNLTVKDLTDVWPKNYAENIRNDLTNSFSKGSVEEVVFSTSLLFEDLSFAEIKEENINVSGDVKNADIRFEKSYPKLENVNSYISYDGNNLVADIKNAQLGKFKISKSFLEIENINDPVALIKLRGSGIGEFNQLKPLLKAITRGRDKGFFYNTNKISAICDVNFSYTDNINNGFDPKYVDLKIEGKLKDATVKQAIKGIDIKADELKIKVDQEGLTIEGDGIVNSSSPAFIKTFVGFNKQNYYNIYVKSQALAEDLNSTVNNYTNFVTGETDLEIDFRSLNNTQVFTAKLDFTNANVSFPYLSIDKKSGEFMQAAAFGRFIPNKAIELADLNIVGNKLVAEGNAIISLNKNVADEFYLSKLLSERNNAEIYYSSIDQKNSVGKKYEKQNIKINGKSYDASYLLSNLKSSAGEKSSLSLNAKLDKLYLKNNVKLQDFTARLKCGIDKCFGGSLYGKIDSKTDIKASYQPNRDDGEFTLETSNFGKIAHGFGFVDSIYKGKAILTANTEFDENGQKFSKGNINIKNFKILDAPIIAKILSLASITGIAELLSGSGIRMKKLDGNFELHDHYLSLQNINARGNSMGLTLQGTVDLDKSYVDFTGAVSPSYSINAFLGKIPVVGFLFNAQKGEGLIATKYSIEGKYPKNVEVSVNPFSALTPGVLRELWGRADTKK